MDSVDFCIRQTAHFARTAPLSESVQFLRGLLQLAGEDERVGPLRQLFFNLQSSDSQLELIATGQMRLDFPAAPKAPKQPARIRAGSTSSKRSRKS